MEEALSLAAPTFPPQHQRSVQRLFEIPCLQQVIMMTFLGHVSSELCSMWGNNIVVVVYISLNTVPLYTLVSRRGLVL